MTFEDFKNECYKIRDVKSEEAELKKQLQKLDKEDLITARVTDPAREIVQKTEDASEKIVSAIYVRERKREYLKSKIEMLPETNKHIENMLKERAGISGVIICYYFLMSERMADISKQVYLCRQECYRNMNIELRKIYEDYITTQHQDV